MTRGHLMLRFAPWAILLAGVASFMVEVNAQSTLRYLVSDPTTVTRVTHCVLTRPTTPPIVIESPVEVYGGGKRCRIDLIANNVPMVGTVTVAFKDAAAGEVGPTATFPFPDPLQAATGLRLSTN